MLCKRFRVMKHRHSQKCHTGNDEDDGYGITLLLCEEPGMLPLYYLLYTAFEITMMLNRLSLCS